jgi:outer membrane lipoprotein-sorting protein
MRSAPALLLLAACTSACTGGAGVKRPYPDPTAEDIVARLAKKRAELTSFTADSTMDYWLGNQRMKGEVYVMGTPGAKVRFAALSPAGGSTMLEMACNGNDFTLVDYQNNCTLTGPCDKTSIAQFFRIELAPDDFFHLAVGTPPVLDGATGTLTWDASHGYEKLTLKNGSATEKLTIDMKGNHLDVIDSELVGADGKTVWSVANTDFVEVDGHRVPGKTRFKSPDQKQDLLVEWGNERKLNGPLDDSKFALKAPSGLPMCGQTVQMQPAQPATNGSATGSHP